VLLVGRSAERDRIERLLEDARRGRSGVLVVRGEAGIGKTALLRHAVERAETMTVARAAGVESEAELEFSGLLEVCRPLLPWLDGLPEHQAEALRGALGLAPARATERFAVGAATLGLLAAAAEENPLLVVVDDAHWLDDASADALRFAARRLLADRVAVIFAARAGELGGFAPDGFEELELRGLEAADARLLLGRLADEEPAQEVVARLCEATGGNPLALVELPELLEPGQLAGRRALHEPLPAGAGVERAFSSRLDRLDPDSRRALVVLAASSTRELAPAVRALADLGLDASALEPAEEAGLVELDGVRFAFRHPLLRAVVHHSAAAPERRRASRALADALGEPGDEERRAWHLAAAAVGPDDEAADALARAALRARDRGGFAAASAAFERAARLGSDEPVRLLRLADAAESAWSAGAAARSIVLVEEVLGAAAPPELRARLLVLRGRIDLQAGVLAHARARFQESASLIEAADPAAAAMTLNYVSFACHFEGRIAEALEVAEQGRALIATNGSPADLRADYVLGRALLLAGRAGEGAPRLERMVEHARGPDEVPRARIAAAAISLSVLERHRESRELVARVLRLARDEGPMALAYALSVSAETELRGGRLERAVASASEGLALARELGQSNIAATLLVVLARVDALRGAETSFDARSEEALAQLEATGMRIPLLQLRCAGGLLALGVGRLDDAAATLAEAAAESAETDLFDLDALPEPDLVETFVRLGREADARRAYERWVERGVPAQTALGRALAARCRGLLADDGGFAAELAGALAVHTALEDVFGEARTRLCLGERLRRRGLRVEARRELHLALELFERLEAVPWAERARSELRASGERLRRREEARDELTPQELQVALQVAEGKTNKEVAAALFLSPKTIEFHLGRIYRKLGLSSRAALARRFAGAPSSIASPVGGRTPGSAAVS
jgi:DNA-binding CsgD family transcriptional regulator